MDNWKVIFSNGTEVSEKTAEYWDNVPDNGIKTAYFSLLNGGKLIFDKFDKICIAKIGAVFIDGNSVHTGYRITQIVGDAVTDYIIKSSSLEKKFSKSSEITIPDNCFRRGVR